MVKLGSDDKVCLRGNPQLTIKERASTFIIHDSDDDCLSSLVLFFCYVETVAKWRAKERVEEHRIKEEYLRDQAEKREKGKISTTALRRNVDSVAAYITIGSGGVDSIPRAMNSDTCLTAATFRRSFAAPTACFVVVLQKIFVY